MEIDYENDCVWADLEERLFELDGDYEALYQELSPKYANAVDAVNALYGFFNPPGMSFYEEDWGSEV